MNPLSRTAVTVVPAQGAAPLPRSEAGLVSPYHGDAYRPGPPAGLSAALPRLSAAAADASPTTSTAGWRRAVLGSFAAFAAMGALMSIPSSAPLASEAARQTMTAPPPATSPIPSREATVRSSAHDEAIERMLERGRPARPVDAAVREYARAQLQGVPAHVLETIEKSGVRIVILSEGESLVDAGAIRPIDLSQDYGDGSALRTLTDRVRASVDAVHQPRIDALEQALAALPDADVAAREAGAESLAVARSDRNEALYKAIYDASGGRLDQHDGMSAEAEALGIDAAGRLTPADLARLHGARTPQEIDGYVRLLRAVNGDERIIEAQQRYAAEPGAASPAQGTLDAQPLRLWREGIVVPAYQHLHPSSGASIVVRSTDAISMQRWSTGQVEGQYFYDGSANALVVHARNLGAQAEPNRVLLHELGHAYEDAISEQAPQVFSSWRVQRDADYARLRDTQGRFPSSYATRSASELSAETFADRFDARHPKSAADAAWGHTHDALVGLSRPPAPR